MFHKVDELNLFLTKKYTYNMFTIKKKLENVF